MSAAAKTRFQKVSLEELKKILPEQVMDGNENHKNENHTGNRKDKKKNKEPLGKASKLKSKA